MRLFFAVIPLIFLLSCLDQPPCIDPGTSPVVVSLYSATDGTAKTLSVEQAYIYDPRVILGETVDVAGFYIPLFPDGDQVFFVIKSTELTDSLLISYVAKPQLFATNCDVRMEYTELELLANTFDSVQLFLNAIPPQIEIYY